MGMERTTAQERSLSLKNLQVTITCRTLIREQVHGGVARMSQNNALLSHPFRRARTPPWSRRDVAIASDRLVSPDLVDSSGGSILKR